MKNIPRAILTTWFLAMAIFTANCDTPASVTVPHESDTFITFKHHYIRSEMPAEDWFHSVCLADLDNDGDLDVTIASARGPRNERNFYWYEFIGPDDWPEHLLGDMEETQQAADLMDVDGDGWIDIVSGNHWYRNSRNPRQVPFTKYRYREVTSGFHDVAVANINHDGKPDIITLSENLGVYWYQHPEDSTKIWPGFMIVSETGCPHGAFGPEGIGDLDGDGDCDIVLVDKWLENGDQGRRWTPHELEFGRWSVPTWGGPKILAARSVIRDLDGDGDNDIVMTECDVPDSTAAIFYNVAGDGSSWEKVLLPQSTPGRRGSLHSLRVTDFDKDGSLEILSIDQEDCRGNLPLANPRWYIWKLVDGAWEEKVILDANLGGHEAWTGDVDGDGDVDIISNTWRSGLYLESANRGDAHADYLENLTIR